MGGCIWLGMFTHFLAHSLTHPLIHLLTHSLTRLLLHHTARYCSGDGGEVHWDYFTATTATTTTSLSSDVTPPSLSADVDLDYTSRLLKYLKSWILSIEDFFKGLPAKSTSKIVLTNITMKGKTPFYITANKKK